MATYTLLTTLFLLTLFTRPGLQDILLDPFEMSFDSENSEDSAEHNYADPHGMRLDIDDILIETTKPLSSDQLCEANFKSLWTHYKRSLKQFTKYVTEQPDDPDEHKLVMRIVKSDYTKLQRLLDSVDFQPDKLRDIDEIMSRMYGSTVMEDIYGTALTWKEYFSHLAGVVLSYDNAMIVLPFFAVYVIYRLYTRATAKSVIGVIVLILWCFDFGVTWKSLNEDEELNRMVNLKRYESAPPNCDITEMSFLQRWFSTFSTQEECKMFYKAKYADIRWVNGALDVFSIQLAKVSQHLGKAYAIIITGINNELPWPLNWIVTLTIVILSLFIIFMVVLALFGYNFKVSSWILGSIEMTQSSSSDNMLKDYLKKFLREFTAKSAIKESRNTAGGEDHYNNTIKMQREILQELIEDKREVRREKSEEKLAKKSPSKKLLADNSEKEKERLQEEEILITDKERVINEMNEDKKVEMRQRRKKMDKTTTEKRKEKSSDSESMETVKTTTDNMETQSSESMETITTSPERTDKIKLNNSESMETVTTTKSPVTTREVETMTTMEPEITTTTTKADDDSNGGSVSKETKDGFVLVDNNGGGGGDGVTIADI